MFDFYSFEAVTARRSFSCPIHYPVKSADQVSLVFPSHLKNPGSVAAALLAVNFPQGRVTQKIAQ